jgi:hypothetical protein
MKQCPWCGGALQVVKRETWPSKPESQHAPLLPNGTSSVVVKWTAICDSRMHEPYTYTFNWAELFNVEENTAPAPSPLLHGQRH